METAAGVAGSGSGRAGFPPQGWDTVLRGRPSPALAPSAGHPIPTPQPPSPCLGPGPPRSFFTLSCSTSSAPWGWLGSSPMMRPPVMKLKPGERRGAGRGGDGGRLGRRARRGRRARAAQAGGCVPATRAAPRPHKEGPGRQPQVRSQHAVPARSAACSLIWAIWVIWGRTCALDLDLCQFVDEGQHLGGRVVSNTCGGE